MASRSFEVSSNEIVIKTSSVNPGLVSIGFMHAAKLLDLILSVKGLNRGLVLLRLAVLTYKTKMGVTGSVI